MLGISIFRNLLFKTGLLVSTLLLLLFLLCPTHEKLPIVVASPGSNNNPHTPILKLDDFNSKRQIYSALAWLGYLMRKDNSLLLEIHYEHDTSECQQEKYGFITEIYKFLIYRFGLWGRILTVKDPQVDAWNAHLFLVHRKNPIHIETIPKEVVDLANKELIEWAEANISPSNPHPEGYFINSINPSQDGWLVKATLFEHYSLTPLEFFPTQKSSYCSKLKLKIIKESQNYVLHWLNRPQQDYSSRPKEEQLSYFYPQPALKCIRRDDLNLDGKPEFIVLYKRQGKSSEPLRGLLIELGPITYKGPPVQLAQLSKDHLLVKITGCSMAEDERKTMTLKVYFNNSEYNPNIEDCQKVFPVEREVRKTKAVATAALKELFKGPTAWEREKGYVSWFSEETEGILNSVEIRGNTAYVDIKDIRDIIPGASSSCGSSGLLAEIGNTVTQFPTVEKFVIAINGSGKTFCEWFPKGSVKNNFCDPGWVEENSSVVW